MNLALQLYSMREIEDQIGLLDQLGSIGLDRVEGFGGVYGDATGYRAAMDKNGIQMPTGHVAIEDVEGDFDATLKLAETLGFKTVIAPYLDENARPTTAEGYSDLAQRLESAAKRYAQHGIVFGWHNHDFEFEALPDGQIPMDILLNQAPSIQWEADLAWVIRGGQNPLDYVSRYGNRLVAVHVKDIASKGANLDEDGWATLGEGVVNWAELLDACRSQSSDLLYILEHDKPSDPVAFASRSAIAFKALWGAGND